MKLEFPILRRSKTMVGYQREDQAYCLEVAESGRLRPSAAACAKKGASGRMQRPPELVPIPECCLNAA